MQRVLADHVHAVRVGGELVFLDLASDSYLALCARPAEAELDQGRRTISGEPGALGQMEAAGLLRCEGHVGSLAQVVRPSRPQRGLEGCARPRALDNVQFAGVLAGVVWRWPRQSLHTLVRFAASRGCRLAASPHPETFRRARIFPELLLGSPWQGECLFRSYLLLRFLRAGGCDANWVFGVRTWPFGAHCWLQVGELVLNDYPERLQAFTPILVV